MHCVDCRKSFHSWLAQIADMLQHTHTSDFKAETLVRFQVKNGQQFSNECLGANNKLKERKMVVVVVHKNEQSLSDTFHRDRRAAGQLRFASKRSMNQSGRTSDKCCFADSEDADEVSVTQDCGKTDCSCPEVIQF